MINIAVGGRSVTLRPPRFTVGYRLDQGGTDDTFSVTYFLKKAGTTYDDARDRARLKGYATPLLTFDLDSFRTELGGQEDTKRVHYKVYRWGVDEFDPTTLVEELTREVTPPIP